jgi:hypothetical protein
MKDQEIEIEIKIKMSIDINLSKAQIRNKIRKHLRKMELNLSADESVGIVDEIKITKVREEAELYSED